MTSLPTPLRTPLRRERFELTNEHGLAIRGEVWHPDPLRGAVIVCHGFKGFSRWGFFPYLAEELARSGLRAITFDFSGSGVGADGESFTEADAFRNNSFTRELEDLALVEREAGRRGWLPERYGLFGHSRGGGMAVLHAARPAQGTSSVGALVTWAAISTVARWTPADVTRWREQGHIDVVNARTGQVLQLGLRTLDEIERLGASELDILAAAASVRAPWLIIHGTADDTVPLEDAERLHRAAAAGVARLSPIGGAGHTLDATHPLRAPPPARLERAVAMTVGFFRTHLPPPG
ncbi:MAG: alpha/beta fold hydrolase [Gemmatimonadaceae bacterium]